MVEGGSGEAGSVVPAAIGAHEPHAETTGPRVDLTWSPPSAATTAFTRAAERGGCRIFTCKGRVTVSLKNQAYKLVGNYNSDAI